MSYSVRPHRWQPTRLPRPWDSPGKNTGVGCHCLLRTIMVKSMKKNVYIWGFPGGSMVKNAPSNAGDLGSIPSLGRSHMLQSNQACAPQLLSLCSRAWDPQLLSLHTLEPVLCNKRSHCNEKPADCSWRVAPTCCN